MKKMIFFHILDYNLKSSYQIASLFHMYIDMGERIAGKQDRSSLIIKAPPPPGTPQIAKNIHFFNINNQTGPILLSSYPLTYINLHIKYGINPIRIF